MNDVSAGSPKLHHSSASPQITPARSESNRWENVELRWDKGKQELYCTYQGKKATEKDKKGKEFLQELSEDARKKLEKGKSIKANVVVEDFKIKMIEEIQ